MNKLNKVLEALKELGYKCEIDEENDITFEGELGNLYIEFLEEGFFNLVYPAFYEVDDLKEKFKVLQVCNEINGRVMAIKCFVQKDVVSATFESFYSNESDFKSILELAMESLKVGILKFANDLEKLEKPELLEDVSGE